MGILAILSGVGSIVCWIMVIIKIFQNDNVWYGVLAIFCPLFAFIYGWMKQSQLGLQKIMLVWSICIGVGIVARAMLTTA